MTMYQELHRWEDAIAVAEARVRGVGLVSGTLGGGGVVEAKDEGV